jgi:hypothetical protein
MVFVGALTADAVLKSQIGIACNRAGGPAFSRTAGRIRATQRRDAFKRRACRNNLGLLLTVPLSAIRLAAMTPPVLAAAGF